MSEQKDGVSGSVRDNENPANNSTLGTEPSYQSTNKAEANTDTLLTFEDLQDMARKKRSKSTPTQKAGDDLDSTAVSFRTGTSGGNNEGQAFRTHEGKLERSSRRITKLTYDLVVESEKTPSFILDLHDLSKQKVGAKDYLLEEVVSSRDLTDQGKKGKDRHAPWRRALKSSSKGKLFEQSLGSQRRFGVRLGKKMWVPTVVNPLEIDLRKWQKKELKEVFEIMEEPRSGMVKTDDVWAIVRACGSEPSQEIIEDILNEVQPINPGYLLAEELEEIMSCRLQQLDPIEEIERAFKNMSQSQTNRIGLEDLRELSKLVDYPLTDDELMEMITAASPTNETGAQQATLGGFVRLMTSPNWYDVQKPKPRKEEKIMTQHRMISPTKDK